MKRLQLCFLAALIAALAASGVAAQGRKDGPSDARPTAGTVLSLLPANSVTEHTINIGGDTLAYTATAGSIPLLDQTGERTAAIFYTAYVVKGAPAEKRPITFVFNGGPGASSAYLHLGLVGPRVVDFASARDGASGQLRDNADSWLKFTDLVLIDPVGSGWSRAAKPDKAGEFWGVRPDAQSLAKIIALYVADNNRTGSPKYLLGESYGGFRAVKVARALQREQGLIVAGILMLSPFLEGPLHFAASRFPLGAALQLPSLAAAELDRRGGFTPAALAEAEHFAMTDYLVAIAGRPLAGDAARSFYARVAEISGLPLDVVARTRGLIGEAYLKRSRGGQTEVVSRYDATVSVADPFPESVSADGGDPLLDGVLQSLGGLFVGYARDQLGFKTELTYALLNREVSGKWDWDNRGGRAQASATYDLRELMSLNPKLRLLVGHGRTDLVTPYMASRYVLDRLPASGVSDRAELNLYKGGHMFYLDAGARAAFTADAQAFYHRTGL